MNFCKHYQVLLKIVALCVILGAAVAEAETNRAEEVAELLPSTFINSRGYFDRVIRILEDKTLEPQHRWNQFIAYWDDLDCGLAVALAEAILAHKADRATGLRFEVEQQGIRNFSTLHSYLLGWLMVHEPDRAVSSSMKYLSKRASPDAWAVALVNVALAGKREVALSAFDEALRYSEWVEEPSVGFLNAFDVSVYFSATELVPQLLTLIVSDRAGTSHAAYLALDRILQAEPVSTYGLLLNYENELKSKAGMRAQLFARCDMNDLNQRKLLKKYILSREPKCDELRLFAESFPNENHKVSENLLTLTELLPHAVLALRNQTALKVFRDWSISQEFARYESLLNLIIDNLEAMPENMND